MARPVDPTPTLLEALEAWTQLIEIAAGYKARALAAGFSEPVAEQMALQIHTQCIAQIAVNQYEAVTKPGKR